MKRYLWTTLIVSLVLTTAASATMMRQEWWTGVGASRQAIIDFLGNLANPYPSPDAEVIQATSDYPGNVRDNYVAKFYGWVTVPETGTYQFHYACDDYGMLYVSQDEEMANAVEVAYVDGWCSIDQWTKYASQHSAPMELKKGQVMAVMAFFQEAGGGDNMDLGWTGPGLSSDIANPTYLTNYITHIPPTPTIAKSPVPAGGHERRAPRRRAELGGWEVRRHARCLSRHGLCGRQCRQPNRSAGCAHQSRSGGRHVRSRGRDRIRQDLLLAGRRSQCAPQQHDLQGKDLDVHRRAVCVSDHGYHRHGFEPLSPAWGRKRPSMAPA